MNSVIEEIFQTGQVLDRTGQPYPLHSNVDRQEGQFLFDLIAGDLEIQKTLEIGCAYGISSLHICSALAKQSHRQHWILDPFQHSQFHGIGVANLERSQFDFFQLIEEPSEFALPAIAKEQAGSFDLVFIDGWHTFDHTLLDLFYANRLVRVGGYIVVDDCGMAPVSKAVSYIANYPAFEIKAQSQRATSAMSRLKQVVKTVIPSAIAGYLLPRNLYDCYYVRTLYSSMVALQKVKEDDRNWNWFQSF
ncbi:MAG: class I SAM-dependent methyltransferase [Leptolyngbya sp. Prado105]|jgi:predicted O-methyltransferase YrrM|nr:class I SAM-dependent methyltransferase [Leptolyngbya sp. Prado105]